MERAVSKSLESDVLDEAVTKYEVSLDTLSLIGGFQNVIYEYQSDGKNRILRFTPESHRTVDAVYAELEWISHLAEHGVSVSSPVPSATGNELELVHGLQETFIVAAFEKADGKKIGYPECLSDTWMFETCGRVTGEMHSLARDFSPVNRRHTWQQNYYLKNLSKFVPPTQDSVHNACRDLMDEIDALPKNQDCYGLIHGDINVGNFHVNDGAITLFDFDECQYSWFVEDIAIQLYYLAYVFGDDAKEERTSQARLFMEHFLKGYTSVIEIDEYWLRQLSLFLRLREIIVYVGMYRSLDLDSLDGWSKDFISQSKMRIENGISIVELRK